MNLRRILSGLVTIVLIFMLSSCGEVPQQDIDAAKAALDAAKEAQADLYLPDEYNAAKATLDRAMAMGKEEEEAMFSNYDEAIPVLKEAKSQEENLSSTVGAKKDEVKAEAEALLARVPEEVKTARTLWRKAPRGKGTREPLQMIKDEITATEASAAEVQPLIDSGDYLQARQKAQAIDSKLQSLQNELNK